MTVGELKWQLREVPDDAVVGGGQITYDSLSAVVSGYEWEEGEHRELRFVRRPDDLPALDIPIRRAVALWF